MSTEKEVHNNKFWLRQAPITIVGVLILGIIGSTLYDLLVKPGLTNFGRFILDAITLGSESLKNAAYSSAALDPTPISGLVLLQVALVVASIPATRLIAASIFRRDKEAIQKKIDALSDEERKSELEDELDLLRSRYLVYRKIFWFIFVPWFIVLYVAFAVHNQSVVIWRTFNTNMAILRPYLSEQEFFTLRSRFSSMETGNEYKEIHHDMTQIASEKGTKLKQIETW